MRRLTTALLAAACAAGLGCGDSPTGMSTAPLTDEQKQQIRAEDRQIDDEESLGRGAKLGGKPKAKKG